MTTWDEDAWTDYTGAARRLDQLRRDAAAAIASQQAAAVDTNDQIEQARQRVATQRSRFADIASRFSITAPKVEPTAADRATAASPESLDHIGVITDAVHQATATLDGAESTLATVGDHPSRAGLLDSWPVAARNAVSYLWYAALATVAVVEIDHVRGPSARAGWIVTAFSLVIPLVAWVVGWLSVGILSPASDKGRRSIWLGAVICAIPLLVGLVLARR